MELHIEFFVEDLARSRDFYTRVLGFSVTRQKEDGFTELRRGAATIALNSLATLTPSHPAIPGRHERVGKGVETVLLVPDLDQVYDQVLASNWPLSAPMTKQPWGMTDFRLADPDGFYIRITAPGGT